MSERVGAGKSGRKKVRDGIEGAKVVELRPKQGAASDKAEQDSEDRRFIHRDNGIWRRKGDNPPTFICGPVDVLAESRDEEGRNWGLLLAWDDRDGHRHEEAFPRALFAGDGNEIRSRLADGGLTLGAGTSAKAAFLEWLASLASEQRARSVTRIGWHAFGGQSAFVLPDETIGEAGERVVLQTTEREASLFGVSGTAEDWRREIGLMCAKNSRLVFAASCAFAAPLLGLLGEEGGGISFKGDSRVGKSTALRVAASVCGGTPQNGAGGYIRSWRSTSNGIESTALASCDALLPLDEMGQLDPREAGEIAYLLSNGQGKARSSRTGGARSVARFRILFLSTGELGLADLNREAGKATKAGQEVRFADLPADAGRGMGLFEYLHHEDTPEAFARYLRTATGQIYGAPLRIFLRRLADVMANEGEDELRGRLRDRIADLADDWLKDYPAASGQVRSVAARFAMVAVGGELATSYGLTGWADDTPSYMAGECFHAWLAERGTVGRREEEQAVQQLRDFIARNGEARFERWVDAVTAAEAQSEIPDAPPGERFRTQNRAGWKRWVREDDGKSAWRYLLTSEAMSEALSGLNQRSAKAVLVERGFLLPGKDGKIAAPISPPGHKKVRAYEVMAAILGSDEGDR
ncbi:DUF927 domain-containing protein [Tanticharoenia sakaeratensis]|uniref:DUF927 domain-containing protein n=1 Tax=Tanticharoenia sakaeratensis NBRC 103193 TaxID=1231623 RepID=A0A0D6MM45_9PROT|nr:DUF927 domain-containing protein [Tanticharoenia sakaeratensis]GAN54526.1 hypothetical protein Tasa_022_025 [Tanticharoenia sakaeratensis NBRC 103193]GBQ23869.1 DNA helicase inner membrane protein [Tanticharoenia sakaeratensis NBRC 103193]